MANRRRYGGIFIGPLTADTGIGTLVEALDLFPAARIEVVGSGPEGVRLAHHPQVRLVGNLEGDELQARLEAAAYLVLPTLAYDATPRPLVDAFANGTPVIASRVGALDHRSGELVTALLERPLQRGDERAERRGAGAGIHLRDEEDAHRCLRRSGRLSCGAFPPGLPADPSTRL